MLTAKTSNHFIWPTLLRQQFSKNHTFTISLKLKSVRLWFWYDISSDPGRMTFFILTSQKWDGNNFIWKCFAFLLFDFDEKYAILVTNFIFFILLGYLFAITIWSISVCTHSVSFDHFFYRNENWQGELKNEISWLWQALWLWWLRLTLCQWFQRKNLIKVVL